MGDDVETPRGYSLFGELFHASDIGAGTTVLLWEYFRCCAVDYPSVHGRKVC